MSVEGLGVIDPTESKFQLGTAGTSQKTFHKSSFSAFVYISKVSYILLSDLEGTEKQKEQ